MLLKSNALTKIDGDRPAGYQYFKILSDHLGNDLSKIFNGELVYPRQLEIHLPGDHKRACNFDCYYCQGRLLEQPLAPFEEDALKIVDGLKGKVPYFIYGGAYSEPLLNPYFLDFLKLTKKHGSYFGIHTNGSLLKELEEKQSFLSELCRIATSGQDYLSISLDAGTPESHMLTKNIKVNWFDEIIEGIRIAAKIRRNCDSPAIRVCYLLNRFNSSEREINCIIEIMQEIKVDSLRFSIPYDLYGKDFDRIPPAAIGIYNYYERLTAGLKQFMAGERKFRLDLIDRGDIMALTREAAEISGILYVMDIDKEEVARILA